MKKYSLISCVFVLMALLAGCSSFLPGAGPSRSAIEKAEKKENATIEIVDVNGAVTSNILAHAHKPTFAGLMGDCSSGGQRIGPGDVLSITIWESPPAALFSTATAQSLTGGGIQSSTGPTSLPDQQVDKDGSISVPFAGTLHVANMTTSQIENIIHARLKGKANDPQVLVRLTNNVSSTVTVVGEVQNSKLVPLTPKCERLLDVLAAAGGAKQQVGKLMVQLTRHDQVSAVPLDTVIRDARENIYAQAGDVVTMLYQPLSFTALGATGKNAEIEYEATGITLAQALGRIGGVEHDVADAQGVFIFRYEPKDALAWPTPPKLVTPDGTVPVIYRVNLRDPATFFASKSFPIKDKDIVFVATAPSVQFLKFMDVVSGVTSRLITPASQAISMDYYVKRLNN